MNQSIQLLDPSETDATPGNVKGHRLLKGSELPKPGDFFAGDHGLEPWEGPNGFRADAFVKPIYRPEKKSAQNSGQTVFSVPSRTFNSQLG